VYIAEVPSSISELKKLETLNLNGTGITGTVDFKHHPVMILISTVRLQRFPTSENSRP
jgi:hypothetical protein